MIKSKKGYIYSDNRILSAFCRGELCSPDKKYILVTLTS